MEFADLLAAGQLAGKAEFVVGPLLRAELEYDIVPVHGTSHGLSIGDAHCQRLFVIHILAVTGGLYSYQGVPKIRRYNCYGVDIFTGEQFAIIAINFTALAAVSLPDPFDGPLAKYFAKVADGRHLHIVVSEERSQMPAAHAADADESHYNFFTRRHGPVCAQYR